MNSFGFCSGRQDVDLGSPQKSDRSGLSAAVTSFTGAPMSMTRLRLPVVLAAVFTVLLSLFGTLPASAATTADWKAAVAGLVDDPYQVHAVAYKRRVGSALPPTVTDDVGDRRVVDVLTDARIRYLDTVRFHSDAAPLTGTICT
jgi:hypothetical protein